MARLPEQGDTVEHNIGARPIGQVERVHRPEQSDAYQFFVRWAGDGLAGWYNADELTVRGGAPASDPAKYR